MTTWLRLCRELLVATSDPKWADEIEKTFYNAYLGAQRPDGSQFVQYTSLSGRRHQGEDHSRLHTNCCNANGPRGYLAFLTALLTADEDAVMMNLYASGTASVVWPKTGEKYPSIIEFCDYASAGNTWGDDSSFRVWLPVEKKPESL